MARGEKIVVFVTCGTRVEAKKVAQQLVEERLAACVNLIATPFESIYRWKGKVERAKEFLLVVKTSRARFETLCETIQRLHSYDMPEVIALPIVAGSREYLEWIETLT